MAARGVSSVIGTFSGRPYTVQLLLNTICGHGIKSASGCMRCAQGSFPGFRKAGPDSALISSATSSGSSGSNGSSSNFISLFDKHDGRRHTH